MDKLIEEIICKVLGGTPQIRYHEDEFNSMKYRASLIKMNLPKGFIDYKVDRYIKSYKQDLEEALKYIK